MWTLTRGGRGGVKAQTIEDVIATILGATPTAFFESTAGLMPTSSATLSSAGPRDVS